MRYALIKDNKVISIIEAASQQVAEEVSPQFEVIIQSDLATTDWVYDTESGLRDNLRPSFNSLTQEITLTERVGEPPHWVINTLPSDVLAQRLAEAKEQTRIKRDSLIAETDFYALTDITMTATMVSYRQALRDVPEQAGFPSEITWPTKP